MKSNPAYDAQFEDSVRRVKSIAVFFVSALILLCATGVVLNAMPRQHVNDQAKARIYAMLKEGKISQQQAERSLAGIDEVSRKGIVIGE